VISPEDITTMNQSTNTQSMSTKSSFYGDFAKLRGEENYMSWKQDMQIHLRTLRLAEALTYDKPVIELSAEEKLKNENARIQIFFDYEKAKDVWSYLEHEFALIWAAHKPQLMCKGVTLEKHFHYTMHLREQLKVAKMDIDPAMFIEVFIRSLTPFYSDALPSLVTEKDMTIDQMFATLTHFRLQRQTLAKGLFFKVRGAHP
ncbi:hypothetical protein V1507DRAFT_465177, partial [Lipomyces tetrasporus]